MRNSLQLNKTVSDPIVEMLFILYLKDALKQHTTFFVH